MELQTFSEFAPTLDSLGIVEKDCTDVELKTPTSKTLPTLDKTKALCVINKLGDIEQANGYKSIAIECKVSMEDVKNIHAEFLNAHNPPEKVVVPEEPIEEVIK